MRDNILLEIFNTCEGCKCRECCKEKECVLFRIEQIVVKQEKKKNKFIKKKNRR